MKFLSLFSKACLIKIIKTFFQEIYEQNAKLNAGEETKLNAVAGLEASDSELSETSDDGYSSDTSSDSSDEDKLDGGSAEKEAER